MAALLLQLQRPKVLIMWPSTEKCYLEEGNPIVNKHVVAMKTHHSDLLLWGAQLPDILAAMAEPMAVFTLRPRFTYIAPNQWLRKAGLLATDFLQGTCIGFLRQVTLAQGLLDEEFLEPHCGLRVSLPRPSPLPSSCPSLFRGPSPSWWSAHHILCSLPFSPHKDFP